MAAGAIPAHIIPQDLADICRRSLLRLMLQPGFTDHAPEARQRLEYSVIRTAELNATPQPGPHFNIVILVLRLARHQVLVLAMWSITSRR